MKEKLAQMERENRQLTFENEILLYRVRQGPSSTSIPQTNVADEQHQQQQQLPRIRRASSCSSLAMVVPDESPSMTRCLSLKEMFNR